MYEFDFNSNISKPEARGFESKTSIKVIYIAREKK